LSRFNGETETCRKRTESNTALHPVTCELSEERRCRASATRFGLRHSSIKNLGTASPCNFGFERAAFHAQDLRSIGVPLTLRQAPLVHRLCVNRSDFHFSRYPQSQWEERSSR
jgi:hypothetical protein